MEILVTVEGVTGAGMTRELAQRANQIPGIDAGMEQGPAVPGAKGAGGLVAAGLSVLLESAIEPLIGVLGQFLVRDRRARIKMKLPDGTEMEIDGPDGLDRLRDVMLAILQARR